MTAQPWIQWCFHHYRSVLLVLALLMVGGGLAYLWVPKESTPDIKIPFIYVSANYEGISPNDGERLILRPLEQHVRSIEGIKTLSSRAFEGVGYLVLEFMAGHSVDKAL